MAKKTTLDVNKLSTQEQIAILSSLKQQAVAWLMGMNGRSVRDDPHLPRNDDGTYSAKDVLAHATSKGMAPSVDDDTRELIFRPPR